MLDIMPGGPPRVVALEQFADGKRVRVRRPRPEELPGIRARARQVAEMQRRYDPIAFNCEHVKNLVRFGNAYSETVLLASVLVVGIGIYALARGGGQ